jgi:hypothetical protein
MTCQPRVTTEELLLLAKACRAYAQKLDKIPEEKKELQYRIIDLQVQFKATQDREVFLKLKAAKAELAKRETRGMFGESEAAKVLATRLLGLTEKHRYHSANVTHGYLRHLRSQIP